MGCSLEKGLDRNLQPPKWPHTQKVVSVSGAKVACAFWNNCVRKKPYSPECLSTPED